MRRSLMMEGVSCCVRGMKKIGWELGRWVEDQMDFMGLGGSGSSSGDQRMIRCHWCDARTALLVLTSPALVSFWASGIHTVMVPGCPF